MKRSSNEIAKQISKINPDILYWRFNKKFFFKSLKYSSKYTTKVIFACSNIRDLKLFSAEFKKPLNFKSFTNFFLKNILSIYNHFGFFYVDALTVNNANQIKKSPISQCFYVPNIAYLDTKLFKWNKPFILWVANIKTRKQPEIFIKAAETYSHLDIDFLMVGKIENKDYLWLEKANNLPKNLHYLGPKNIDLVNGALKECLFLITTSTQEGFSNNVIQSWYQKKPVIAFEFDPSNYIKKHKLGYVANGDEKLFYKQIKLLIDDEVTRNQLGNNAFEFANNHFSTNKSIEILENLFYEVLNS